MQYLAECLSALMGFLHHYTKKKLLNEKGLLFGRLTYPCLADRMAILIMPDATPNRGEKGIYMDNRPAVKVETWPGPR